MGAGASVAQETKDVLATESAKDLTAADVNTPRGESAKAEVIRLRKLLKEHCKVDDAAAAPAEAAPAEAAPAEAAPAEAAPAEAAPADAAPAAEEAAKPAEEAAAPAE